MEKWITIKGFEVLVIDGNVKRAIKKSYDVIRKDTDAHIVKAYAKKWRSSIST